MQTAHRALLTILAIAAGAASAQDWPARPLRVIVAGEGPRGPPQGPLDGGQPFPPDTSAQGGQPHEVTFEVSSAEPFARHFCFAAEARR